MDIDVFIQGNADFRVTTGKSRRSIQGASRARHARLPLAVLLPSIVCAAWVVKEPEPGYNILRDH
jgi:hypothetical protein